jgi:SHS2 domain-containing protein
MPFSFLGHTADVRMRVTGATLEDLFRDALLGMVALADPVAHAQREPLSREIAVESGDQTALLVDFLNESLASMHTAREAYTGVTFHSLTERSLRATLDGYRAQSFGEDIKAVTYHEADVRRGFSGGWETTIVFDI